MRLLNERPVANGLRTDHPIPDLPFVDDSHIPVDDPVAIEAVGRNKGEGMWGREDACRYGDDDGGWFAFTTDPVRHDLGWCVRSHPVHGRSVVLYRDEDAISMHEAWVYSPALLFRSGGYWHDGKTWYRPAQVYDGAREEYFRRIVLSAMTVTAADELVGAGDPSRARVLNVTDIDLDTAAAPIRWRDDLALWASHHEGRPLDGCIVRISAPELAGDQLVDTTGLAEIGGIAASTLRAYISRSQEEVPQPQAVINGRSMWARPVAEEWAEMRRRSREGVTDAVAADRSGAKLAPGIAEALDRYTRIFFDALWGNPARRKLWGLRWRNQAQVQAIAADLGWYAAAELTGREILSAEDLGVTIRHAFLDEIATMKDLSSGDSDIGGYDAVPHLARMLEWLIRYHPATAASIIPEITGDAERRLGVPREQTERMLRGQPNWKLDADTRREFYDRVLTPASAKT